MGWRGEDVLFVHLSKCGVVRQESTARVGEGKFDSSQDVVDHEVCIGQSVAD